MAFSQRLISRPPSSSPITSTFHEARGSLENILRRSAVQVRGLRAADFALCCLRNASADRETTSENCRSCLASGLVLRQIIPMVREGCGFLKRATDTDAERASTAMAISGINVTPMPALTIWTSVDRELASSMSRGSDDFILQNDRA